MKYKVPKFLDRETKFFALFTFKQLFIIGAIGLILFIFYYIMPKGLFVLVAIISVFLTFSLMFVNVNGVPLSQLFVEMFHFVFSPKRYVWQKRFEDVIPRVKLGEQKKETNEKKDREAALKLSAESKIRRLSSKIEIGATE